MAWAFRSAGDRHAGVAPRSRRRRGIALLALFGLLCTASIGSYRQALDLPGPSGVWTEKLAPDDVSEESAPADKAQASATMDTGALAELTRETPPPLHELIPLCTLHLDRCRPGHDRGIDHPPRRSV